MNFPLFERSEGFYYSLGLTPDWEDRLLRLIDMEELSRKRLDDAEMTILHFNQLGYSIREISWYYGSNYATLRYRMKKIFDRLAVRTAHDGASAVCREGGDMS